MIDVEPLLVSGLDRLVPVSNGGRADWQDALRRAGRRQPVTRRQWLVAYAAVVAAVSGLFFGIAVPYGGFAETSATAVFGGLMLVAAMPAPI